MKVKIIGALLAGSLVLAGCQKDADTEAEAAATQKEVKLETLTQKVSYIIGWQVGTNTQRDNLELDVDAFAQSLRDVQQGVKSRLTQEEMQVVMQEFQTKQQAAQEEAQAVVAEANKKEGEEFLAENAKKEGVVQLENGMQYKVLVEGTGPKPKLSDTVEVNYRGTLIDGTEFDSSYKRGESISFPLTGVIAGWREGLQLMPEGSKWELYIPSDLAYGPGGTGGPIGPNATLIFEVELLKASVEE